MSVSKDLSSETLVTSASVANRKPTIRALGTLAAGVAHEINNPLSCVYSNLEQIRAYYRLFEPVIEHYQKEMSFQRQSGTLSEARLSKLDTILGEFAEILEDSIFACERIDHVVRDLHLYANLYKEVFGLVSLNEIVSSVQQRLRDERPVIDGLMVELDEALPPIFTESSTVEKVITRLLHRATQSVESIRHPQISLTTYSESGHACLKIMDNGIGAPNEYVNSVFDPFLSDPSRGGGNNISLALGRIAIEELGGTITAVGEYGSGSHFILSFPGEAA